MIKINRKNRPQPSIELDFSLPEIERFKLKNNLEVMLVQRHLLPILRFNLISDSGSRYDPAGKRGLSNLFSMMLDEGAGDFNALELSDEFDTLGSNLDTSSNSDALFVSLRTLKENLDKSLELYSTVIKDPHLKEEDFEREKRKVLIRLLQHKDDPEEIADVVFEHLLYGKKNPYAYSSIGLEDDVKNLSINEIKNFYTSCFSPLNSTLLVIGDTTRNEIEGKLNSLFNDWNLSSKNEIEIKNGQTSEREIFFVDKKNSVQSEIRAGHISSKRNDADYFQKLLLNTVLGGQFSSRINLNLREDKGYTYGAFSRFSYYKDAANFYVSTSVGIENTANAIKEIIKELENIKDGVTPEELDFAKSSTIRKFPSNFETNRQIAMNLTGKIIHNLPDNYFDTYLDRVKAVTLEEVNKTAEKNIFPDKVKIVVVGDKEKLLEQFKDLNLGKITEVDYEGNLVL